MHSVLSGSNKWTERHSEWAFRQYKIKIKEYTSIWFVYIHIRRMAVTWLAYKIPWSHYYMVKDSEVNLHVRHFWKHPMYDERVNGWQLFYHRGRANSRILAFFKSRQPSPTPCGMKSLSFELFGSIKIRITIERRGFKQFSK